MRKKTKSVNAIGKMIILRFILLREDISPHYIEETVETLKTTNFSKLMLAYNAAIPER